MNIDAVLNDAESRFPEFVEKLKTLARIPSVSFEGFPKEEVVRSAEAVASLMQEEGLENVEILRVGDAHPYVYGDWLHAPGKPTLLLYAHHDVQPPGRIEKWKTDPFEPTQIDDRLFGRGAADDKAGIIAHTSAISAYLKTVGKLPVNVRLIVEGEEEIGSGHLEKFLRQYQEKLTGDVIILTDTDNFDVGTPSITTSLRGIVVVEVEVSVMDHPLHSGMFGGPAPDAVLALSKMLSALVDDEGKIAIPGIYDAVAEPSPEEKECYDKLGYTDEVYKKRACLLPGVEIVGGKDAPPKKLWRLPSLSVNAIQASSRKNAANILNESAWCRVSIRTVPDMKAQDVEAKLKEFLKSKAPWGVQVSFSGEQSGNWWSTKPQGAAFDIARKALTEAFGKTCVLMGQGGSIPFVEPFSNVLGGAPALLIGVEDPYTNAHSENESVHLGDLQKAVCGAIRLYDQLADWSPN